MTAVADHYTDLLIAGVEKWGKNYADLIEIQAVNDGIERGRFAVHGAPPWADDEKWRAVSRVGDNLLLEQQSDCEACGGAGDLDAIGRNGRSYSVECPACGGSGEGEEGNRVIVVDYHGNFLMECEQ